MILYTKIFILIFLLLIALFTIYIYYYYKKIYSQKLLLHKIEHFEDYIQNIKNKDFHLNENIIQYIMNEWSTIHNF